jgi:hypothetical protein
MFLLPSAFVTVESDEVLKKVGLDVIDYVVQLPHSVPQAICK